MTTKARRLKPASALAVIIACAAMPACKKSEPAKEPDTTKGQPSMTIESTAFAEGERIPKKYTGDGEDVSPPLSWTGLPDGTKELALIMDDPDAPSPEPWVHWAIYKIPADAEGLEEGIPRQQSLSKPPGALQGKNSWPSDNIGYRGPAPPRGHGLHHYHFKLYALDSQLEAKSGLTKKELLKAMEGRVLAEGELVGRYER